MALQPNYAREYQRNKRTDAEFIAKKKERDKEYREKNRKKVQEKKNSS